MSETLQFPVSATDDEIDFDSIEVINKDVSKKDKWILNFKRRKWSLIFIIPALIYVIIFFSQIILSFYYTLLNHLYFRNIRANVCAKKEILY